MPETNSMEIIEVILLSIIALLAVAGLLKFRKSPVSIGYKAEKTILGFLGAVYCLGGTIKSFEPVRTMFTQQLLLSEIPYPTLAKAAAQLGELSIGLTFICLMFFGAKIRPKLADFAFHAASVLVLCIMGVAFYVHFHPNVPAEILPLKTKPPYLTIFFVLLTLVNLGLYRKNRA